MKIFLLVLKIGIGIPLIYCFCLLNSHYGWGDSWDTAYKIAPVGTVCVLFAIGIYYGVKSGG
jgi:hypothetical protein